MPLMETRVESGASLRKGLWQLESGVLEMGGDGLCSVGRQGGWGLDRESGGLGGGGSVLCLSGALAVQPEVAG